MRPCMAAIGFGRVEFDENLVALHGGVDLVRRNENVFITGGSLTAPLGSAIGPDKPVAVAVQIEAASGQILARSAGRSVTSSGKAPVLAVELE